MSVPNQIPESNYVGNGTTTTFAANFEYASDSDVFVTVNGVTPEIGQATFANGVFTFITAPANGTAVRVYRSTPIERDTEYDNHDNVFRPRVVNIDFDRVWFVLQEYLLSLGITNSRITQEIADRIQADAEMMNYILNEDNELKADYILRDENLKKYVDQTIGAIIGNPDFQGIEAQFVKDASGKTQQYLNDQTKTYLDNFPFYIPYNALILDYAPQFKTAIESGRPIVLTKDANYPFLTPVNAVVTMGVTVHGNNATLNYDGATHIGDFIKIASSVAVKHFFYLTHVDGKHKATRCLYVESSQNNSAGESEFYFNNSSSKRAKRQAGETFLGGSGIHVRGAFKQVVSEYSQISDCMLGTGAGTPGSVGINGLAVTFLTQTSYPLELSIVGGAIEKVYSEDPAYTGDQDGILFFSATSTNKAGKVRSLLSVQGANFKNCWGRSIKSQCRNSVVVANNFFRDEGNSTFQGNTEVDIQVGQGEVSNNTFEYENGHTGGNCIGFGADANVKRGSILIANNEVYLDAATTLPVFATSAPRDGKLGVITCHDNKIFGKVVNFARLYVRGAKNIAVFKQNYAESIELDGVGQRNFIEVRASGSVAGETNFINIDVENNINDGVDAVLVKDGVSGVGMNTLQSGRNNLGFIDEGAIATTQGQKTLIPFRASAYASKDGAILYSSTSASIAAGATQSFTLPANASLLNVQMRGVPTASAVIAHGANGALMSQVGTGNVVYSNGTVEPVTQGTILTIWRDATDPNKLHVKNNNTSTRFVSIHFFSS